MFSHWIVSCGMGLSVFRLCFLNATKKRNENKRMNNRTKQKSKRNGYRVHSCHCHVGDIYFCMAVCICSRSKPFHFDVVQSTRILFWWKRFSNCLFNKMKLFCKVEVKTMPRTHTDRGTIMLFTFFLWYSCRLAEYQITQTPSPQLSQSLTGVFIHSFIHLLSVTCSPAFPRYISFFL